ncbi:cingulin isoform X2 [Spea bombifrons]|uniref:cingulin isoform X2 n=1 Tax=Spea bombifrons TaxID=233779 RepID=UPI002348FCEB|nr:cingulin isoform X2 [Spea bombifrons]
MADQHIPVGQGVQIRFIDDLKENKKPRSRRSKQDSYGVAIRVQGIDGQPFVVLNSGDQSKSSYGVQIKSHGTLENVSPNPPPDYQGISTKGSRTLRSMSSESELPENPYANKSFSQSGSQYSSTSDEEQSSKPRSKARGNEGVSSRPRQLVPSPKEELRRSQSYGSLLDPDADEPYSYDHHYSERSSTIDTTYFQSSSNSSGLKKTENGAQTTGGFRSVRTSQQSTFVTKNAVSQKKSNSASLSPNQPSDDIDTKPLSSVDSLINKFDVKGQVRGRTARRSQALKDERKRSQSLDGRKSYQDTAESRDLPSGHQSLVQIRGDPPNSGNRPFTRQTLEREDVNKSRQTKDWLAQNMEEPVTQRQQRTVQAELQLKSTPDLLRDQQSDGSDPNWQIIYNVLRDGSSDSDSMQRRKANLLLEKFQSFGASPNEEIRTLTTQKKELERKVLLLQSQLDSEIKRMKMETSQERPKASVQKLEIQLEERVEECSRLKELFEKKKGELNSMSQELMEVRMSKEQVETKMRSLEDKLLDAKEEISQLRSKGTVSRDNHALLKELQETQEELDEVLQIKQKQEELLRQRERELTALKGALKEEVANHDVEMDRLRQQYQNDVQQLRKNMDNVSQDQLSLETERQKINQVVRNLERELEESGEEINQWKDMFQKNKEELRSAKQELLQVKLEKEEFEDELNEMKNRFSLLQSEFDQAKKVSVVTGEAETIKKELKRVQDQMKQLSLEKQRQEESLHQSERELSALKGALKEEVSGHDRETERLREKFQKENQQIKKDHEDLLKTIKKLESEKLESERLLHVIESTLQESRDENDDLRRKILGLEAQLKELNTFCDDLQRAETRLKEKIGRLESDRKQMEESLGEATDQGQEFSMIKRDLETRLEESQRSLRRLTLEYDELQECYQEEMKQKDQLKKTKNELEDQKRLLDKSIDKLTRELESMSSESRGSLQILQTQLEEYKEKSRRDITEAQKQAKEKATEVERTQLNVSRLQEEIQKLKQALQESQADKETAVLDKQLISQRLQSLEQDIESKKRFQDDRSRQVKVLEDKMKRLEEELDEERNTVELLTERVNRSRDQMDQLRAELMQERSSRQDLECDKISLERQNKDLKSRLASMEGQHKSSANVSQLEANLQEIQERLQSEEREKNNLLSSNRKLERKIKELNIQLEDERLQVNDQKDQLNLRVKALKRQVDEAEEEIERMEGLRKKAVREMEEQQEINEQLQARLKTMEKETRRKPARPAASDDLSSDGEYDSLYDPSSITSLLTESNLQTSSC